MNEIGPTGIAGVCGHRDDPGPPCPKGMGPDGKRLTRARHAVTHATHRLVAYTTGACALLLVAVSAVAAVIYAASHRWETVNNLASSTLTGIGMAIGGCLGSALILRFKAARSFLRAIVKDIQ